METNEIPIFDRKISTYRNLYDTSEGKVVRLSEFLFDRSHEQEILHIRQISDKNERDMLKRQLPAATISGVFSPDRKQQHLKVRSALMCVDIDGKDNPEIEDMEELKAVLSVLPQVAYAGLSVSGRGIFLIIPIRFPLNHIQQFLQLQRDFLCMSFTTDSGKDIDGIIIDGACKNINRTRTMSLDLHPYVNNLAVEYEGVYVEPMIHRPTFSKGLSGDETFGKAKALCNLIELHHVDLTPTYDDWFHVGRALATLGEAGRELFHICSRQYPGYRWQQTEKLFSYLLNHPHNQGISIATFFYMCKQNGVTL